MRNRDWPTTCAEKIGIRLELKTIPIVKYREIVERVIEYEQKEAAEALAKGEDTTEDGGSLGL